ncbi:MAG: haloacid dehalogenase type II [Pseudomonadota bacterium]
MALTLAFDIYGTLINPHGVVSLLETMVGPEAQAVSNTWRSKQLEYTFRRGLMEAYANFAVCTRQALDYACAAHRIDLTPGQKDALLSRYRELPAFADVGASLARLAGDGHRLVAFSNGTADAVHNLLRAAAIEALFDGVVSVDAVRTFKPAPAVYAHLCEVTGSSPAQTWLISSNPFDVIGASSFGMKAAWVRRDSSAVFDPWDMEPDVVVGDLEELPAALDGVSRDRDGAC